MVDIETFAMARDDKHGGSDGGGRIVGNVGNHEFK